MHDLCARKRGAEGVSYNISGWRTLISFCQDHDVDTVEFSGLNDGELIHTDTCLAVAAAIEAHQAEYNALYGGGDYGPAPALEHARIWRGSGGMRQY